MSYVLWCAYTRAHVAFCLGYFGQPLKTAQVVSWRTRYAVCYYYLLCPQARYCFVFTRARTRVRNKGKSGQTSKQR